MSFLKVIRPTLMALLVFTAHQAMAVPPANSLVTPGSRSTYTPRTSTISPYVGLATSRTSAVANYYTVVRPQLIQEETNRRQAVAIQQLEQELRTNAREGETRRGQYSIRGTGYPSRFMSQGQYFGRPIQ